MSHPITPTDGGNVTSITVPSDGDFVTGASVEIAVQGAADLAAYCRGFLLGTRTGATLNTATLSGTTTVDNELVGDGTDLLLSQPGETVTFNGDAHFAKNTFFANGNTHIFEDALTITAGIGVTVPSGGAVLNNGAIKNQSHGYIAKRRIAMVSGVDLTVDPRDCDVVTVPFGAASGHTITLSDGPGDQLVLRLYTGAVAIVTVSGTGLISSIDLSTASGKYQWVDLLWSGTGWEFIGYYLVP